MWKKIAVSFAIFMFLISPYAVIVGTSSPTSVVNPELTSQRPLVYVDPPLTEKDKGQSFTVGVKIFNLTDAYVKDPEDPKLMRPLGNLWGFDIRFAWDPAILKYESHLPKVGVETYPDGVLYEPVMEIKNEVNPNQGNYTIAYSSMPPEADVFNNPDQNSTVFEITFTVLKRGACDLRLTSIKLATNIAGEEILYNSQDGSFQTSGVPVARFTTWPSDGFAVVNKPIMFNASESTATAPRYIKLYIWKFGDNVEENGATPIINHTYTAKGVQYWVSLRVMDDEDVISAPKEKQVTVVEKRDIAVKSISFSRKIVLWGKTLMINVNVSNIGGARENFTISTYYNATPTDGWTLIQQKQIQNLLPGSDSETSFNWDTSTLPQAIKYYNISASLSTVPHEASTVDNSRTSPKLVLVTTSIFDDIALESFSIYVVATVQVPSPFLVGENITMTFTVVAQGTTEETQYNLTLQVTKEPDVIVLTQKWDNESLESGAQRAYLFYADDLIAASYTVTVNATAFNATAIETDNNPSDNFVGEAIRVIAPPITSVASLPPTIYVGDVVTLNASGSSHPEPDGQISEFRWDFTEPEGGSVKESKYGAIVEYVFNKAGNWTVTLNLRDNWFSYDLARPKTHQPYRQELTVRVDEKASEEATGIQIEILYAGAAVIVIALVGTLAYWRLKKPKTPPSPSL